MSPASARWTSTQSSASHASRYARSSGRNPAVLTLPFAFLMSRGVCAMLMSPMTTTRSCTAKSSRMRAVIASRNAYLSSILEVPACPEWT